MNDEFESGMIMFDDILLECFEMSINLEFSCGRFTVE